MKKYEIVSLGTNCIPRTILTRWNIKPKKAQGELSCPFDLVSHKFERILYYIENDFKDYCEDLHFELIKRHFFDFRKRGLWKKNDGTKFFHDKDCKAGDIEKLTQRITNRIINFRQIISSDTPILFVLSNFEKNIDIEKLYSVIKNIRKDKKFKIAVLDLSYTLKETPNAYILKLPAPIDKYINRWNRKYFVNSKLGKYFEKCFTNYIKFILENEFTNI